MTQHTGSSRRNAVHPAQLRLVLDVGGGIDDPRLIPAVIRSRLEDLAQVLGFLEALATAKEATVLEHVTALRVQRPVATLARPVGPSGQLDEAVVEGKIVAEGVLPALRVLAVVGKAVHDKLIDLAQCHDLVWRTLNSHGRQSDVRIRRLLVAVGVAAWARHGNRIPVPLFEKETTSGISEAISDNRKLSLKPEAVSDNRKLSLITGSP